MFCFCNLIYGLMFLLSKILIPGNLYENLESSSLIIIAVRDMRQTYD